MKTFVSYVIQDEKGHKHESAIVTTQNPPYSFSSDLRVSDVMQWAEEKKKLLKPEQELVITNIYKL